MIEAKSAHAKQVAACTGYFNIVCSALVVICACNRPIEGTRWIMGFRSSEGWGPSHPPPRPALAFHASALPLWKWFLSYLTGLPFLIFTEEETLKCNDFYSQRDAIMATASIIRFAPLFHQTVQIIKIWSLVFSDFHDWIAVLVLFTPLICTLSFQIHLVGLGIGMVIHFIF